MGVPRSIFMVLSLWKPVDEWSKIRVAGKDDVLLGRRIRMQGTGVQGEAQPSAYGGKSADTTRPVCRRSRVSFFFFFFFVPQRFFPEHPLREAFFVVSSRAVRLSLHPSLVVKALED